MAARANVALPAQAVTIMESHDGQNAMAPPSVNKVYQILPKTTFPANPFNGAGANVEFVLPSSLGKLIDAVLQIDLTFNMSSGTGGNLFLSPTTLWCDRREDILGSSVIESQDSDQIHMSSVAYLTDNEYNTVKSSINIGDNGGMQTATAIVVPNTGSSTTVRSFYLPVWSGAIHSFQPFLKGFSDEWRYRFWFAKNGIVNAASTTIGTQANLVITCTALNLWVTEAQLSAASVDQLEQAHRRAILYRGILQSKFTSQESSVATTSEYRKPLTTFVSDTAGMVVFCRPNSTVVADQLLKSRLQYVGLLDSGSAEVVQRLNDGLTRYFVQPETLTLPSVFANNDNVNSFYILPLCANLQAVLENGKVAGGLRLSGQEQIALLPAATLTNTIVTAHSYEYAVMQVQGKRASVNRRA